MKKIILSFLLTTGLSANSQLHEVLDLARLTMKKSGLNSIEPTTINGVLHVLSELESTQKCFVYITDFFKNIIALQAKKLEEYLMSQNKKSDIEQLKKVATKLVNQSPEIIIGIGKILLHAIYIETTGEITSSRINFFKQGLEACLKIKSNDNPIDTKEAAFITELFGEFLASKVKSTTNIPSFKNVVIFLGLCTAGYSAVKFGFAADAFTDFMRETAPEELKKIRLHFADASINAVKTMAVLSEVGIKLGVASDVFKEFIDGPQGIKPGIIEIQSTINEIAKSMRDAGAEFVELVQKLDETNQKIQNAGDDFAKIREAVVHVKELIDLRQKEIFDKHSTAENIKRLLVVAIERIKKGLILAGEVKEPKDKK